MTDTVLVELYEVTFGVLEPADDTVTVVASDSFGMSTAGGGGGAVDSVNSQTGTVVLDAGDIGADSTTLVGVGTTVQAVLEELDNGIADHLADTTAAHAASAISFTPNGSIAATDVQAAIQEVRDEAAGATDLAWNAATSTVTSNTGTDATLTAVDASNPGLMTVAQKSKLDGIESGATADQSAAEILAALLTVDGSGSGLDADLLDGNSSAAFATAGHDHTGTYQPLDSELTAIAGLTSAADTVPYFTGSGTAALATVTSFIRTLLDDANQAAARTTLGLTPGTDVQAYNSVLTTLAGLTPTNGNAIVGNGSAWTSGTPTVADPPTVQIIARQTLK